MSPLGFTSSLRLECALAALAALAALGCGGDHEPADPVALTDFPSAAQAAICDWAVRCRHVPDLAMCEQLLDPKDYDTRRAEDAVAAGRLSYDAELAGECVAATREQACLTSALTHESCREMFAGLVGPGGLCTSSFECQGGAACEEPACEVQCCVGVCGEPLEPTPSEPRKGVGASCSSHFECNDDAYCETDGRCTPMPTEVGQRCLFGCAFGDLYCDLDELVCKRYGAEGEACDVDGLAAPPCDEAWSYCDGVCVPLPGLGESCDPETARCIPTAFCVGGQCRQRGQAGDPCASGDQCEVACDIALGECVAYAACTTDG